jgi:putative endonuclease
MQYGTYIRFSEKSGKYYVGYTTDIEKRLEHHNTAQNRFLRKGVPWTLILFIPCPDKISAMTLEIKLKNMGLMSRRLYWKK